MIFKVSFLAIASITAYAVSQVIINSNSRLKQDSFVKPSVNNDNSDSHKLLIEKEKEQKLANSSIDNEEDEEVANANSKLQQELDDVSEIDLLQNLATELETRLERKLLELYGVKEHESYIIHLRKQVEDKTAKADLHRVIVAKLQAEMKDLQEEIKQGLSAENQLGMEKKMMADLQKKILMNSRFFGDQLLMLNQQVSGFQKDDESSCVRNVLVTQKLLEPIKDLEFEINKIKRENKELELEKRELAVKLVAAQARIAALSSMTECKDMIQVEQEVNILRNENKVLSEQVERLQKIRFDMVEELIYQRWLNTCLRYEFQNHQHLFSSISSNSLTESDEIGSTTIESASPCSQTRNGRKYSLIHNIKWWRKSKDESKSASASPNTPLRQSRFSPKAGLIRRFSTSMVPDNTLISKNKKGSDSTGSSETTSVRRVRRVSFSDSVRTVTFREGMYGDGDASPEKYSERFEGEKSQLPSLETLRPVKSAHSSDHTSKEIMKDDAGEEQASSKIEIALEKELHSSMFDKVPRVLIAVFFTLLFMIILSFHLFS